MNELFFRKKEIGQLQEMHHRLSNSFIHVREDVHSIFAWIRYLHEQQQDLARIYHDQSHFEHSFRQEVKQEIKQEMHDQFLQLQQSIDLLKKMQEHSEEKILLKIQSQMKEDIKTVIDYYYNFEHLLKQVHLAQTEVSDVKTKIHELYGSKSLDISSQLQLLAEIKETRQKVDALEQIRLPQKQTMRERLIKKITQKSKDYVKNLLISYIRKYEKISALKLREMIVEEQGLASKSSFYRILAEIESLDEIELVKEGKEKYYFYKLIKHH